MALARCGTAAVRAEARGARGGSAGRARRSRRAAARAVVGEVVPGGAGADAASGDNAEIADFLVSCPDAKGVVAALAQVMFGFGCNIVSSDQHTTEAENGDPPRFYQRLRVDLQDLHQGSDRTALRAAVAATAAHFDMEWSMHEANKRKRVAVLVSKSSHCLYDLLIRHEQGQLDCDIVLVAGNHVQPGRDIAERFGVPFHHLPIDAAAHGGDVAAAKAAQETDMRELLRAAGTDILVLARYMQVLSDDFCEVRDLHFSRAGESCVCGGAAQDRCTRVLTGVVCARTCTQEWCGRAINIHHSFLPAFEGARPYHRAHARGVKLIGATAHFVTTNLDEGPIVCQEVTRVSHSDSVNDLKRKGADLERLTLARALRLHLQNVRDHRARRHHAARPFALSARVLRAPPPR